VVRREGALLRGRGHEPPAAQSCLAYDLPGVHGRAAADECLQVVHRIADRQSGPEPRQLESEKRRDPAVGFHHGYPGVRPEPAHHLREGQGEERIPHRRR
jgi:hypothetical protein